MPTVEDYFDDDSDLPLPSSPRPGPSGLSGSGLQGALLEEINTDDPEVPDLDYALLADQGRGIYGENAKAPPPRAGGGGVDIKGKGAVRTAEDAQRPVGMGMGGGGPNIDPKSAMGGFMGDMMKLQKAEDERLEKLRRQMGGATIAADPSVYKDFNVIYPIYLDAKVSIADGRRVPRKHAMWWPQAQHIAQACRALLLPSALEPEKTHPADWQNPGRVKVQFEKDGRFLNPIVKNRTQLYKQIAIQLHQMYPALAYTPANKSGPSSGSAKPSGTGASSSSGVGTTSKPKSVASGKTKPTQKSGKKTAPSTSNKPKSTIPTTTKAHAQRKQPSRPPQPAIIPHMDDRLPLHSPVVHAGVAVSAVRRDVLAEREAKKKGTATPSLMGAEDGKEGKEAKAPKVKRIMVRGKR